jgi:PAS domain S-box-containing protein
VTDRCRPPLLDRFRAASGVLGMAAAAVGVSVLGGWILGISRLLDFYKSAPEAKFNAGLCLILCGLSLWLHCRAQPTKGQSRTAVALAAAVVAIAALTLMEVVTGWDLGIDNLIVHEPAGALGALAPGRMAPSAAAVFLFYGAALLVIDTRSRRGFPLASAPALIGALGSLFVGSGYLYGVEFFSGFGTYAQVAPPIVLGQLLLAFGVLAARSDVGITAVLVRPGLGGRNARRLCPLVLALPLGIGVAQVLTVRAGWASDAFTEALATATIAVVTGAFVLSASRVTEEQEAAGAVAREELRESDERHSRLFESMEQGVVYQMSDGTVVSANPAAERILGITLDQMKGRVLTDPLSRCVRDDGSDLTGEEHPAILALRSRRPILGMKMGVFHPVENQYRWVLVDAVPDFHPGDASPFHCYTIFSDITERKRAEDKLSDALAELERSNRDLAQFASIASHELQEPLRMVGIYTQLLAKRYEGQLDEKAQKYVAYAVDGAIRMQRLVNDLLTYAHVNTHGDPIVPTDAGRVLGQVIGDLAAAIEESGAVITHEELPLVRAEASQLWQVFQNLLANALKFRSEEVPRVHVSVRDEGRDWVFAVRDNGIGIDRQFADKIFEVFQRLHTRPENLGTGIGLAVCRRIVERHGGRIWFESEPGQGSTFFFTVPK